MKSECIGICCGSILSLVQILFSFVLNHYNTLPYLKNKKIKFEPRMKLNHNPYTYSKISRTPGERFIQHKNLSQLTGHNFL